jgi:hypothetical protein
MAARLQHLQCGAAAVEAGAVLAAIGLQRPEEYGIPPGCLDSVPPATRTWRSDSMRWEQGHAFRVYTLAVGMLRCGASAAMGAVHFLAQSDQPSPRMWGRPSGKTVSPPSSGVVLCSR